MTVRSQIPVARGLGSSAALAAAAAAAAGADDPFAVAAAYDGHPENAAASVFGGLVAATTVEGRAVQSALPLSEELAFVVIIPDRDLATPEARGVLPETLSRADAVFNLGRMGLLVAGLADPAALVPAATGDRIHQPARTALFPESAALLAALVDAGALAASWSGAGPSLIGIVRASSLTTVRAAAEVAFGRSGVPGRVVGLRADRKGLVFGDEAEVTLVAAPGRARDRSRRPPA